MEKISSIIPPTRRVTSVDLQNAHPVRSSVPSFGRPQVPVVDRLSLSNAAAMMPKQINPEAMAVVEPKGPMVDKMINDFFMRNDRPVKQQEEEEFFVIVPVKVDDRNKSLEEVAEKNETPQERQKALQYINVLA